MSFYYNLESYNELAIRLYNLCDIIDESAKKLSNCINSGGTIYIAGNGGSASDASHFAAELVGRFYKERKGLPCVALNNDMVSITAIGNDYGFDAIYERQLEALFNPEKDIFIGISTSGNSENIIRAIQCVVEFSGVDKVINLLGKDGGKIHRDWHNECQNIIIPSNNIPRIQEVHMLILHSWAEFIEDEYVKSRII